MGTPRTFVGFSSTDISKYWLLRAWKKSENIEFDFCDCQLREELNSENEEYIKRKCRDRLDMAGTYIMLIGEDTRHKHKYVRWEAEIAIEKECRIIAVNLDQWRTVNESTCPLVIRNVGAVFIPFSAKIINHALKHFVRKQRDYCYYTDEFYKQLGYRLVGERAIWPSSTLADWYYRAKQKTILQELTEKAGR
jgi:hypothetical protein